MPRFAYQLLSGRIAGLCGDYFACIAVSDPGTRKMSFSSAVPALTDDGMIAAAQSSMAAISERQIALLI